MAPVAIRVKQGTGTRTSPIKSRGLFITFEGIEGSGKSTQSRLLADFLKSLGLMVVETREPGGTPVAERIRDIFLETQKNALDSLTPETETALVLAARGQHVASLIRPALAKGGVVLCDRFSDSTLAYQGYGRGLNISKLQGFNRFATQGLTPDMTFLFDLPVQQGLARRRRDPHQNRIDQEALAFHTRVRKGFLTLAKQHTRRVTIIKANRTEETIAQHLQRLLEPIIMRRLATQRLSHS